MQHLPHNKTIIWMDANYIELNLPHLDRFSGSTTRQHGKCIQSSDKKSLIISQYQKSKCIVQQ
jgi:hypothetical protein